MSTTRTFRVAMLGGRGFGFGFCVIAVPRFHVALSTPCHPDDGNNDNANANDNTGVCVVVRHHDKHRDDCERNEVGGLAVNFREVVQSVRTGNADVAKP